MKNNDPVKMYCIFSKEALKKMNGIRGKLASQAGHAYLHAFWDALSKNYNPDEIAEYQQSRAYKITLVVETDAELVALHRAYQDFCGTALIEDAGFTVFKEPTITCLGIGPVRESRIDPVLRDLRTLT